MPKEYYLTPREFIATEEYPVVSAGYVGCGDDRLDDVIEGINDFLETHEQNIGNITTRVTANEGTITELDERVTALEESGGGGGGTTNYNELTNIPKINGVSLKGNLSAQNLGLANAVDIPTVPTNVSEFTNDAGYINEEQYMGTVTSVAVKMNGATKGTVTSSGTIDLGTVITSHQSLDACAKTADLGSAAYKTVRDANGLTHTGWVNHDTDAQYVPTMAFMAFWNGAYLEKGSSNLKYCNKGAFGTIVTKSEQSYITTGTGTALKSGDNIDTLSDGVYYSASNSVSLSLAGTLPNWGSGLGGFRLEQFGRSGGNFKQQILVSNWHVEDGQFLMRFANSSTLTWGSWFVYGGTKLT